ncbi:MAG: AI-2E family transporter [Cyanobacteria bacterium QH_8_48_120]|jgi:predicted PurR-regulated permease PerM|nr:MAG: AI-2E family transporter [Cyanobacteria bacterium QH_1_48_107]PSO57815.1 MAG: AI-2E family transporter [Cyanobacteria bacterium QH_10_48_56]PSO61811.1 MAG: AI-2E family transporter [Cyanobacteria bacterium QH_6_48_35]PSO67217.1 MAG: AI-2E family transporter [Cyanobacteria bacterium QH_7_48_89]PSO75180.1 MAG: AI-2E family transporter [Cyanobacteria bacterium QH_8_48_120]PSO75721.1 MAG: AI-2E family transporter [Cyanobacteria bacterium QH_3_48_40]PSO88729.1 MAG: AI-2E family transporter
MSERRVAISTHNLLLIGATVLLVVLLWQLRSLLVVLMISVVLASALAPMINNAQKLGIPRLLAVVIVYLVLIAGLTGAGLLIGPTVVEQIQRLSQRLPGYLETLRSLAQNLALRLGLSEPGALDQINRLFDIQAVTTWAFRSSEQLLVRSYGVTRGIIGGVFSVILAVLLSGYMLSGSQRLIRGIVSLFPKPWDERFAAQVQPFGQRMGGYIQGRVLVSAILGVAISIGLRALGLSEFALSLGVIAGLTNLIPFFGPVLGSIPALIVAIAQGGGWTVLWVLLLFAIIQNVETYVLDPLLVGNSVRVHPLYQLLAVLGGAQVLGLIGALIVPPWVAGTAVVVDNLYVQPKKQREQQASAIASGSEEETPSAISVK